ncbi:hypothetical protein [Photorhabdus sp. SF281]
MGQLCEDQTVGFCTLSPKPVCPVTLPSSSHPRSFPAAVSAT